MYLVLPYQTWANSVDPDQNVVEHVVWSGSTLSGFIHVREMSGKFNFFQGQGIVREFCDVSGKNESLQKCQGNVREFYILTWWSWNVWPRCIFFAKFKKFSAPILSGKFEFVSGKCQGILVCPKCMNPVCHTACYIYRPLFSNRDIVNTIHLSVWAHKWA